MRMIAPSAILGIARKSLRTNKMRSLLTALGIIIGVAAVVAMFAIGTGANKKVAEHISSMGSNLLIVRSGSTTSGGQRMGMGATPSLTFADAEAIQKECPAVALADPSASGAVQVVYGNMNWSTRSDETSPIRTSEAPRRSASWGRRSSRTSSATRIPSERPSA
jgi:putative ABC transport system permease protein